MKQNDPDQNHQSKQDASRVFPLNSAYQNRVWKEKEKSTFPSKIIHISC